MKLSEAFVLGTTAYKLKPGCQFSEKDSSGCALGVAYKSIGYSYNGPPMPGGVNPRTYGTEQRWAWLTAEFVRPCDCRLDWYGPRIFLRKKMPAKDIIAHIFDAHIFGKKNWTTDNLADYIRSIEPEEQEQVVDSTVIQESAI